MSDLLKIEPPDQGQIPEFYKHFERCHGGGAVADLLAQAGLQDGAPWRLRVVRPGKGTGTTPRVRVVRAEPFGVILQVKPAGNDSCCVCTLIVERAKPWTSWDVEERLRKQLEKAQPEPAPADAVPTDDDLLKIIQAVHATTGMFTHRIGFINNCLAKIAPTLDAKDVIKWTRVLQQAFDFGFIADGPGHGMILTEKGKEEIDVVPMAAPAKLIHDTGATLASLLANERRLRDALAAIETVREFEKRETELLAELATLRENKDVALSMVDPELLAQLKGG